MSSRMLRLPEQSQTVLPAGVALVGAGNSRGLEIVVELLSADAVRVEPGERVVLDPSDRVVEGVRIAERA